MLENKNRDVQRDIPRIRERYIHTRSLFRMKCSSANRSVSLPSRCPIVPPQGHQIGTELLSVSHSL